MQAAVDLSEGEVSGVQATDNQRGSTGGRGAGGGEGQDSTQVSSRVCFGAIKQ